MFTVRFWGVRGSIACPGPSYQRYGGNTSCVEVRLRDRLIIFDAGTGIRELGTELMSRPGPKRVDLLLTHTHMDHITGLPFFTPLFDPTWKINIHAGHLAPERSLIQVIGDFMSDPVFPVPPSIFNAKLHYHDFHAGEDLDLHDGLVIKTTLLRHPNRATGYRLQVDGKSICYITDTEHVVGQPDQGIIELARDADLMIYDSTYTDEAFADRVNWGHSTWQEGVRLANAAGVKTLVIFHHDPVNNDEMMDAIDAAAQELRPGAVITAKEGLELHL